MLLLLPVPLEMIVGAFGRGPPESWRTYVYFGLNRTTAPDYGQWREICDWHRVLPECIGHLGSQRRFIDIAVILPDHHKKRLMTVEAVKAIITLFPSVHILRTLANHDSPDRVAELFCAALDSVQNKQYDAATLTTLLPALLRIGLTLPASAPKAFAHDTLTNGERCGGGTIFHCPADVTDGQQLLHLFVASLTAIASDMCTRLEGEYFTVEQYGGERFRLPLPTCVAGPHSLTISNWSVEDCKLFFDVTQTSEFCLAKPTWQEGPGSYREVATAVGDSDRLFTPLSLGTLSLIVKNSAPFERWVWLLFSHHRDRLPESVCQTLLPRALMATDEIPADFLNWLRRCQSQQLSPPHSAGAADALATPLSPEQNLEQLWAVLADKALLDAADLALLSIYHKQLSFAQLVSVVERASLKPPAETLAYWRCRLTEVSRQRSRRNLLLRALDDESYDCLLYTSDAADE